MGYNGLEFVVIVIVLVGSEIVANLMQGFGSAM